MIGKLASSAAVLVLISAFANGASATPSSSASPPDTTRYLQVAGLFGESDEEKAARLAREQHEADQDSAITDLKQRVHDLEQSLQQATGQNEQLSHRVQELKEGQDKQQKDTDYKLCSLTAQLMGVANSPDGGIPCNLGSGQTAGAALPQSEAGVPDARKDYNTAMNLLARAQYEEARAAFRSFVDANPQDAFAPQALYWTGNIAYVQKDYAGAATAFAEGIKKYPTSSRGPDNMFKLGQSLIALGQTKEGCLTLGAIKSKYPKAPASIFSQAASTRAASCK